MQYFDNCTVICIQERERKRDFRRLSKRLRSFDLTHITGLLHYSCCENLRTIGKANSEAVSGHNVVADNAFLTVIPKGN
ncbi:hypothetical protein CRM82_15470 [Comamonas terrigena]|uniref:Uncharacterized protein n=1 Tax=Comamonas terrigena TaxID=32013 RepID=A0A2A7UX56_COMTR|nr:hypothetical protein [Comamonas terrigena]PEH89817.1 hypothetical protein CRM82_15470 [Comamonas terrigena]